MPIRADPRVRAYAPFEQILPSGSMLVPRICPFGHMLFEQIWIFHGAALDNTKEILPPPLPRNVCSEEL
jgi:hypothetical protein